MSNWGPQARADYLASIGAESARIREHRDTAFRGGLPMLGDIGPTSEVARLWAAPAIWETVTDVAASDRANRMVTSQRQINVWCACGGEASIPPVVLGEPFICESCWQAEKSATRTAQVEVELAARTAASDLAELADLYNRPGGLPNLLARR